MTPSLADSAARGVAMTVAVQAVRLATQLVSVVLLARLLTPEDFGLVVMVTSIIGVAEIVRDMGLSAAAVQAESIDEVQRSALWWINTAIGGLVCVIIMLCAPLIALAYDDPRLIAITLSLAPVFLLGGATTQLRADLSRSLRFGALNLSELTGTVSGVIAASVLAAAGAGYWALVGQQLVMAFAVLVSNFAQTRFVPKLPNLHADVGSFIRFGLSVFGTQLVSYAGKNADNLMLGLVWGPVSVGYYSRAFSLMMLPINNLNVPITRVALPILSRVRGDPPRFDRFIIRAQLLTSYVTVTVFLLASALATPLVNLVFGARWSDMAPILSALCIVGIFRALGQVSYWMYLAKGFPGAQFRLTVVATPLLIGVMAGGLPWGPFGVAVGGIVGSAIFWGLNLVYACRTTGTALAPLVRLFLRATLGVGLPIYLICVAVVGLRFGDLTTVGVSLLVSAGYTVTSAFLFRPVRRDLRALLEFGRRAIGA